MIRYFYVPESEKPYDYYDKSVELHIDQIIHGNSDIIKGFIDDYSQPCIIEIPQFQGIFMDTKVFEECSDILIKFVDEWINQQKYTSVEIDLYEVNIDNPSEKTFMETIKMKYNNRHVFFCVTNIKKYGEYFIKVFSVYEDGIRKEIDKSEIIVYKKQNEERVDINDFQFTV